MIKRFFTCVLYLVYFHGVGSKVTPDRLCSTLTMSDTKTAATITWDPADQSSDVLLKNVSKRLGFDPFMAHGVGILLGRMVKLRNFRRGELARYVKKAYREGNTLTLAVSGESCSHSLFRTPMGWTFVGENILNVFQPFPGFVTSNLLNKFEKLLVPWPGVEKAMMEGGVSWYRLLVRCSLLLANESLSRLYFVPPETFEISRLVEALKSSNIFSFVDKIELTGDEMPDLLVQTISPVPLDFLRKEGGAYRHWSLNLANDGYFQVPSGHNLVAVVASNMYPADNLKSINVFKSREVKRRDIQNSHHATQLRPTGQRPFEHLAKVYVINLQRFTTKWVNTRHILVTRGHIPPDKIFRFDAVDGKDVPLSFTVRRMFDTSLHRVASRNPFEDHGWRRGVLGCAMSHLQIWSELASRTDMAESDFYLILEDDIKTIYPDEPDTFPSDLFDLYANASADSSWDILYLGFTQDTDLYHDRWVWENAKRFSGSPRSNGGSTFAYALRRKGAMKLLKKVESTRVHEPIDWFMIDLFDTLVAYKAVPNIFINTASDVQSKKEETSTTMEAYGVDETEMRTQLWKDLCLQPKRNRENNLNGFHLEIIKPMLSAEISVVATTFEIQVSIGLLPSTSKTAFETAHMCSQTCYFLRPLTTAGKNIRDPRSFGINTATLCTPFFERYGKDYFSGVAPGKYILFAQVYDYRNYTIGAMTSGQIDVKPEVVPIFTSPTNASVVAGKVQISVELGAATPSIFLAEQSYAKICMHISGEHLSPHRTKFLQCKRLGEAGDFLQLDGLPYGWLTLTAWVLGVSGEMIGEYGYVHFFVAVTKLDSSQAENNWKHVTLGRRMFHCSPKMPKVFVERNPIKPYLSRESVTLLVLVNRGSLAFENAVKSWEASGLFEGVAKVVFYFQKLVPSGDQRFKVLKPLLANDREAHKFTIIGSRGQRGIARAFLELVSAVTTSHALILEEDFFVEDEFHKNVQTTLDSSLEVLRLKNADIVHLRHRKKPGEPFCSRQIWRGQEELLAAAAHRNRSSVTLEYQKVPIDVSTWRFATLNTIHWLPNPTLHFRKEVLWNCGTGHFCAYSTHAAWTNNPSLFLRDWFLEHFRDIVYADWTTRLESAINLTPHAWQWKCFVIAHGEGLFTHKDIDTDISNQSPCRKEKGFPDSILLFNKTIK